MAITVSLVITPLQKKLTMRGYRYWNTQTTTVLSGNTPVVGVPVVMYENAGKSGGYAHKITNSAGQIVVTDIYPRAGSYTEWSVATVAGVNYPSQKITVIVP